MKHQTITVLLLLSSFTALFAQQEIFLDNTPKEKIKLNNLKGFEFSGTVINNNNHCCPVKNILKKKIGAFPKIRP